MLLLASRAVCAVNMCSQAALLGRCSPAPCPDCSHCCSVAFDTQKPGDTTRPLVAAIHTITTTSRMNVWLLAAMLLPKPCLPLIGACARAFPPASQRLLARANAFVWNTSVALVEASISCSLPCSLVRPCMGCCSSLESHKLLSAISLQFSLLRGWTRPGSLRMGSTLLLTACMQPWLPFEASQTADLATTSAL